MSLMMTTLLFVFSFLLETSLSYYPVPVVEINLDSPANTRWNNAIDAVLSRQTFNDTFAAIFAEGNKSFINKVANQITVFIAQLFNKISLPIMQNYKAYLNILQQNIIKS